MTGRIRALVSMWRQKVQTFILMGTVFLISTLIFGVISVNQALSNTDQALRARLPAVAILRQNADTISAEWEETGVWPHWENISIEILDKISALPYVRSFNYTVRSSAFYSEVLRRHWDSDLFLQLADPIPNVPDQRALSHWCDTPLENFILNGVGNPQIWEMEAEIITLVDGRTFNVQEMTQGLAVAVVSEQFLTTNHLALGDVFLIDQTYHKPDIEFEVLYNEYPAHVLASRQLELEIIGVFGRELIIDDETYSIDIQDHLEILNQIFVPASFIATTTYFLFEEATDPELLERFEAADSMMDFLDFTNMYFLLYDPLDLANFHEAVAEMLPLHWQMDDYSFIYADMAHSMNMVGSIADRLFVGITIAMVLVLVLLTLLFLQMRRVEMGIYLALGAHKRKIAGQFLLEVLVPSFIGISLSVFSGYLLASSISTEMIQNYLAEGSQAPPSLGGIYEILGIRYELTMEEMLALYEVQLEVSVVLMNYFIILSVILISTLISMGLVLRMNPKKVLLS